METYPSSEPPKHRNPPPRRLKKPPPPAYNNQSSHQLRRTPSAPIYPSFNSAQSSGHQRSPTLPSPVSAQPSSTTSSLRRQNSNSPVNDSAYVTSSPHLAQSSLASPIHSQPAPPSRHSVTSKTTPELIGAPFDAQAIYKNIELVQSSQPPPRPRPPHHAYTADPRFISPKLRQSASFAALGHKMETVTPPRSEGGTKSPRQRYSDEGDAGKNRKSDGSKKKGGFSSFMNSMLGSPRRPTISTPTNPMHVTHVSIDNETGEYTVCDTLYPALHEFLFLPEEIRLGPSAISDTPPSRQRLHVSALLLTPCRAYQRNGSECYSKMVSQNKSKSGILKL